ncbi:hypothetical protein ACFQ5N_06405 [Lutibacter holmesii]|uniref:Replication initiation protein n=1 Tax=Lutibacter holmesii TaxID=1137985 RepID=A0ABW3WMU4_9FLAO
MKYEKIDDFAQRVNVNRRTIFRFYANNPKLKEETKMKNRCRVVPISHKRFWNIDELFESNKAYNEANRMMSNLLLALQTGNPLVKKLWFLKWTHIITISPKGASLEYCTSRISQFYDEINSKYGAKTNLRILYNSEKYAGGSGYHTHAVLNIENKKLQPIIIKHLERYFKDDRIEVDTYDFKKGFLFYSIKDKKDFYTESWGFNGNNLKKEKLDYEI